MLNAGQVVLLINPKGKRYLRVVKDGDDIHTHDGKILMEDVIAAGYGRMVKTHLGRKYQILKPTVHDLIKGVKRQTQIMYPKEIGYLLLKLGIGPGCRVIESGSGSGGLTTALAYYVGDTGKVYTHERRPEFFKLVSKNLEWSGLSHRVEQFNLDIEEGFQATDCDALFLDVRTPWDYLHHIPKAVIPGSMLGFLLPTTNQVSELIAGLDKGPFTDIEVVEILLRRWKPVAERLRPDDRMVAHTGFLVFARSLDSSIMSGDDQKTEEKKEATPEIAETTVENQAETTPPEEAQTEETTVTEAPAVEATEAATPEAAPEVKDDETTEETTDKA
ncbi:tRNA (adenine-N1)-methyltransferase [Maridesulfovibrio ferrireducens]|uniref:tRNA (adenine-N1)-methyltransferase n=1 Tax=Maridesulfovibrio ferrireducens TaxID=246191 RepID=UPI001A25DB73|nr:tRNA (adenine-N1)-methyltransferase [Maridesulfovibrio ferrireducens]MBI9112016.1 tRNA (adenine-N1)-methyltransferase [Maridesulfovibrio ferrireducens]